MTEKLLIATHRNVTYNTVFKWH